MKTPDEIKKALECCSEISVCSECPYYNKLNFGGECVEIKSIDALNYIRQLENHIGELTEKVTQLEDAQPKWNKIADRPPEEELKKYLVAFQSNGKYVIDTAVYNGEFGFTLSHWIPGDITHWMPLPEPPKEEAHD